MSSRGKIKSKVVQATINNKDVLDMFHGVLGTGERSDLNMTIVYPKYLKISEHCGRYLRLLEALRDSALMGRFPAEAGRLAEYVAALREDAGAVFSAPDLAALHPPSQTDQLTDLAADYSAVTREEYDAFTASYNRVKSSNIVNTIVVTCKNLVPHKKSLEDVTALKDRFLTRSAGLTFAPLPDLPAVNFKQIYISDRLAATDKQFVLMVLHKMFTISHDVYEAMSSPDIDVDEFVQVVVSSLDDVKKHIPRCDEAFDKIRDSVSLLKGNFDGYYKDFVASNNPTIIMENFVLDVSKSTKSSPKVTGQFRRIIAHYRKLASQQAQNPQMRTLFAQVDKNFQELEKRSREADACGSADSESDTAASPEADSGDAAGPAADPLAGQPAATKEDRDAERRRVKNRKKRDRVRRKKVEQQLEAAMASPAAGIGLGEDLDSLARVLAHESPGAPAPSGSPDVPAPAESPAAPAESPGVPAPSESSDVLVSAESLFVSVESPDAPAESPDAPAESPDAPSE